MKKVLFTLMAAFVFAMALHAQDDKYGPNAAECKKYLSYYTEYYKAKDYDSAMPSWRKAFALCPPSARQNMFIEGANLYRKQIAKCKNVILREQLIDTLLMIHDIRLANFPKYAITTLNAKGSDVVNYIKDDNKKLYTLTKEVIDLNGKDVKPSIIQVNFTTACTLYADGEIDAEDLINLYESYNALMQEIRQVDTTAVTAKVATSIESLFIGSKVASCENLIQLFTPRFEAASDDLSLIQNIVKMMGMTEGCTDNDLFLNAVTKMHELNPSHLSAYNLYRLNSGKGNVALAIDYLQQAIAAEESDDLTDADYYFELANYAYKNKNVVLAESSAQKAITLNSALAGKVYFLLGSIWSSVVCSGNEIEQRAKYWVAVDYLEKAKRADDSFKEEADNLIKQFRVFYPQAADAFMYDLTDGQSYTVSCGGLRAQTTVKTQK